MESPFLDGFAPGDFSISPLMKEGSGGLTQRITIIPVSVDNVGG
jgi:hypothetical protein